jgi:hypothetical protein
MDRAHALAILGLAQNADLAAVRAAWRRLAWDLHPDRTGCPSTTLRMARVNVARDRLLSGGPVPGAEAPAPPEARQGSLESAVGIPLGRAARIRGLRQGLRHRPVHPRPRRRVVVRLVRG